MEPTSQHTRSKKTRAKVVTNRRLDPKKVAAALKLIDEGNTYAQAAESAGITRSAVWSACSKRMKNLPVREAPVVKNWEVWRRALEPEPTRGVKQMMRKFYLIERFATRAQANKFVEMQWRNERLYPSGDFHIANLAVGIDRPPPKARAPDQTPETRHIKRSPWDMEPRRDPAEKELRKRLKAAQPKPVKPLRTVAVAGTVVEIPMHILRREDYYSPAWYFRKLKGGALKVTASKYFTDSKYGGPLASLEACKKYLEQWRKSQNEVPKAGKRRR